MRRTASLIVGGGPAGAAAAIGLARFGFEAELIERSDGPHEVVCGGFLGWDALAALRRLGVDPRSLRARPIHRMRLVSARRSLEAALPGTAAGLSGATQLGFGALSSVIMGWLVPVWPLSLVAAMLIWVLLGWAALTFLVGRR